MRILKSLVIMLFLVGSIALSITPLFLSTQHADVMSEHKSDIVLSGTDSFVEDFTSTTYLNNSKNTAYGWGSGVITSQRLHDNWENTESYTAGNPVYSIDIQGRELYLAGYNPSDPADSLQILDIQNVSMIDQRATRSSILHAQAVKVWGDNLFIGTNKSFSSGTQGWVGVYNISDPNNIPSPMDQFWVDGAVSDFAIVGHFLYVAAYESESSLGFKIFDIEDPANIQELTVDPGYFMSKLRGLEVQDELAFLADGTFGLYIANITDLSDLGSSLGHINTGGDAHDVILDGDYLYMADGPNGLSIIDISDVTDPQLVTSIQTGGDVIAIDKLGDTVFAAEGSECFTLIDVADPTHPVETLDFSGPTSYDCRVYGRYLFLGTSTGVHVMELNSFLFLEQKDSFVSGYDAIDIEVQDDIAYVVGGPDGLYTINMTDKSHPVLLDQINDTDTVDYRKLDVQGDYAYVASYGSSRGLRVFDVSNPSDIKHVSSGPLTYATDVCVDGDMAYVADSFAGVYFYNVSDPTSISYISYRDPIGMDNATAVTVQGTHLYVASDQGGSSGTSLFVFEITDRSSPNLIGELTTVSSAYDIEVDGNGAWLADGGHFRSVNITEQNNPTVSASSARNGASVAVAYEGPYVIDVAKSRTYIIEANEYDHLSFWQAGNFQNGSSVVMDDGYAYATYGSNIQVFQYLAGAASFYNTTLVTAWSKAVDTTDGFITNATLDSEIFKPTDTYVQYWMSADGGAHWQIVSPGVLCEFAYPGSDLVWAVDMQTFEHDKSVHLYEISIDYAYTMVPTTPILDDPGETDDDGEFFLNWSMSTDSDGSVVNYSIQMSTSDTFSWVNETWFTVLVNYTVTGLENGTYYFRVQSIDNDGVTSSWSNTVNMTVRIPASTTTTTTTTTTTETTTGTTTGTTSPTETGPFGILPPELFGINTWYILIGVGVLLILVIVIAKKK